MTYNRSHIMQTAWTIARDRARAFGGPVRPHLSPALQSAWGRAKFAADAAAHVARLFAAPATIRPVAVIRRDMDALDGLNRWNPGHYAQRDRLTAELRAAMAA